MSAPSHYTVNLAKGSKGTESNVVTVMIEVLATQRGCVTKDSAFVTT